MTDHSHPGVNAQPVSHVEWVPRESLRANDYNPNHVAPPERKLLRLSILEDGWTQPIVRRPDDEIVDGFHRWQTSDDPDVWAMTDGLVPVVTLEPADPAHQRMSTIRHNRARGTHHVVRMADIVAQLVASGLDPAEVALRLGMESDEVRRLLERGRMTQRGANPDGLGSAWRPVAKTDPT